MIRDFEILEDCVMFRAYLPHRNHSVTHLHPVNKGSYHARNGFIKWLLGVLWKYLGLGGRP